MLVINRTRSTVDVWSKNASMSDVYQLKKGEGVDIKLLSTTLISMNASFGSSVALCTVNGDVKVTSYGKMKLQQENIGLLITDV